MKFTTPYYLVDGDFTENVFFKNASGIAEVEVDVYGRAIVISPPTGEGGSGGLSWRYRFDWLEEHERDVSEQRYQMGAKTNPIGGMLLAKFDEAGKPTLVVGNVWDSDKEFQLMFIYKG